MNNVEYYLHKKGGNIPDSTKFPCYVNYRQETDVSPEILSTNVNYFQSLISILRWIFELSRSDITIEKYALASMMVSPIELNLKEIFRMFVFLKVKHNSLMVFDPTEPDIDMFKFTGEYWL